MHMLQIEELKVEVGGKTILNNLNMEVPKGQTHTVSYTHLRAHET